MLNIVGHIPLKCVVACSGGPDSMALLDFCYNGRKDVSVIHVNHGTSCADLMQANVEAYCTERNIPCNIFHISYDSFTPRTSIEAFWGRQRNAIFQNASAPVLTAHHLDDAVEWWIMTSLRGKPRLLPIKNANVLRPLLLSRKTELIKWCLTRKVQYVIDPSNEDGTSNDRARLRRMMPELIELSPGIFSSVKKLLEKEIAKGS